MQEKCGVFGVVASDTWPTNLDVAHVICVGLVGLQHRGQEAAGIVTAKTAAEPFAVQRGLGLVSQVFNDSIMLTLKGNIGVGHVRYSTMGGGDSMQLVQPFIIHTLFGSLAMAHNGELVNSSALRNRIQANGVGLSTFSDSELLTQTLSMKPTPECEARAAHLAMEADREIVSRFLLLMSLTHTSYSLVVLFKDALYALRDPFGNRPLCLGLLRDPQTEVHEGYVVSSESCSFASIYAKLLRDVAPGEIVKLTRDREPETLVIVGRPADQLPAFCIFEYVYFARPDSVIEGQMVYAARMECGKQLAIEAPIVQESGKEYIVSPIPESSIPAALGFAQQAGLPYVEVFCKNRYVGRTFIQPSTRLRRLGVAKKFGPLADNFRGKCVILIDDSIVRGTTIGQLVRLLRESGAAEVHIRVASPPLHFPCYMGINIPTREELIANQLDSKQLAATLGARSLIYLTVDGLVASVQRNIPKKPKNCNTDDNVIAIGHCTACLTGKYPVEIEF